MSRARRKTLRRLWPGRPSWRRRVWNAGALCACWLAAAAVVLPLALIVGQLLAKGLPTLTPSFFLHMPKPVGEPGGGMANAIVGTLTLLAHESNRVLPHLFEAAAAAGVRITTLDIREPNLEAVFLHLTGRALRD